MRNRTKILLAAGLLATTLTLGTVGGTLAQTMPMGTRRKGIPDISPNLNTSLARMAKTTGAMQTPRIVKILCCFNANISEVSGSGGGYWGLAIAPVPPAAT